MARSMAFMVALLVCCCASSHSLVETRRVPLQASSTANATASASANASTAAPSPSPAGVGISSASTSATAGAGATASGDRPKDDRDTYDPDAEAAFFAYVSKCEGGRYDPAVTSAGECGGLSGDLCSKKNVKCSEAKTDFLDASGAVIANGDNLNQSICYVAGPRKGLCVSAR